MAPRQDDTIAAIATPAGEGALAIVRLSGKRALETADRLFTGRSPLSEARGFTIHYGRIRHPGGDEIDEALASVFRSPNSFTGEDSVELSCHGGMLITHLVLEAAFAAGARQAEPGEFTKRAFLNGRIDLSQAEAVADLIAARTDKAVRQSLGQLSGRLGSRIADLKSELMDLCALLEIDLDFSEDGIGIITEQEIERRLLSVRTRLAEAVSTFAGGRRMREGLSVPIVGKPNAGKSSLFNALLRESRAIVTHVPGTTRDFIEESIVVSGLLFRLIDTAGIRVSDDIVESEGISKTLEMTGIGDILLVVEEATSPMTTREILDSLPPIGEHQKVVIARTKSDLKPAADRTQDISQDPEIPVVEVSALNGTGIRELEDAIVAAAGGAPGPEYSLAVTNERHRDALKKSIASLDAALESQGSGATNEFIAFDVRECVSGLSEITGEILTEDVLNTIFSRFCVGK
jgi:tRNA modification GTPase